MTGLNWKSDAPATVVRRYRKGTGDSPKRHLWGKILEDPGRFFVPGLLFFSGNGALRCPRTPQHGVPTNFRDHILVERWVLSVER